MTIYTRILNAREALIRAQKLLAEATTEEERQRAKAAIKAAKRGLPILGLLNAGTGEFLLAADFDHLPPGFTSWDDLAKHLTGVLPEHAVLTRTSGVKCKLCILFNFGGEPSQLTPAMKVEALRLTLPPHLAELLDSGHIDTKGNAMSVLYLPSVAAIFTMATELKTKTALPWPLGPARSYPAGTHQHNNSISGHISVPAEPKPLHVYASVTGPRHPALADALASLALRKSRIDADLLDAIVRTLEAQHGLASRNGFAISSKKLAREQFGGLGRYKREESLRRAISRYLRILVDAGLLEVKDATHRYGEQATARRYVAKGALLDAIVNRFGASPTPIFNPSAQITPGTWNVTSFRAASHFYPNADAYVAFVLGQRDLLGDVERPSHFWKSWGSVAKARGMEPLAVSRERLRIRRQIEEGLVHIFGTKPKTGGRIA